MKEQLIKTVNQIRQELSAETVIVNSLDKQYAISFNNEKESLCDTIISQINKEEINENNLQDTMIGFSESIKLLIQKRSQLDNTHGKDAIIQRAKYNAQIDTYSTLQAHIATFISEIARKDYQNR